MSPITTLMVTSPVFPDEVNTAEAVLPETSVVETVPIVASLTVNVASLGIAFAAAPE